MADEALIIESFRAQAGWCARLGSPFTAALLSRASNDIEAGGPVAELLKDWTQNPYAAALALRFAGALNFLVLDGRTDVLAFEYPESKPEMEGEALWKAAAETVRDHRSFIRKFIDSPVQTNELRRSICLLGGFLEAAKHYGLPLRIFEMGASAGLNLLWDKYHYAFGGREWGDEQSPISLATEWEGDLPPLEASVTVATRTGCDINPVDVTDDAHMKRALAYIWPDQPERIERFKTAAQLVRDSQLKIDKADAGEWLAKVLADSAPQNLTVLFHSVFWQYVSADSKAAVNAAINQAAARATSTAPFAWLRMEPETADVNVKMDLRLSLWPDDLHYRLAWPNPHGINVKWVRELIDDE